MELISDGERRISVEELNTTKLLAHARQQADERKLDDILIVDVDAHHYETENYQQIFEYMENPVLKHLTKSSSAKARHSVVPSQIGYQDMGGRVLRAFARATHSFSPSELM